MRIIPLRLPSRRSHESGSADPPTGVIFAEKKLETKSIYIIPDIKPKAIIIKRTEIIN